jgi:antitoxin HicB
MHYAWPVELLEEPDDVTVTCPDVPEMVTCGRTVAEALDEAVDALATALSFYTDDGRKLPVPSPARGRPVVAVPALTAAKLALHEARVQGGVSNVELARRLGTDEKAVRRLRDPLHGSRIEAVEAALRVLGRRLEVSARAVA